MKRKKLRKLRRRTGFKTIAIVVLLICIIVSYKRIALNEVSANYIKRESNLEMQIEQQKERSTKIKEKKAYMQTKKYIEDVAREKLGLVYEDEIIFKADE